jgi:hypothetical protein
LSRERPLIFPSNRIHGSGNIVPKPDYIDNLERRQKSNGYEIAEALTHNLTSDLIIADLKRRELQLRNELERLRYAATAKGRRY